MPNWLSVTTVFFTVWGYPVSYIELVGTGLYLWSVWLIARRNVLTWPVGLISVVLYLLIFYQVRLYSDVLEQFYYIGASVYGWWHWTRTGLVQHTAPRVSFGSRRSQLRWAAGTLAAGLVLGAVMSRASGWWPAVFPAPAAYPYLDALTTVMSLAAMWLMARQRTESWLYWIVVDGIGIGLYFAQGVRFIALQYVLLLAMALDGLVKWRRVSGVTSD